MTHKYGGWQIPVILDISNSDNPLMNHYEKYLMYIHDRTGKRSTDQPNFRMGLRTNKTAATNNV